ncbi:MAG TPA: helix-turn-helix domain-containing protein [Lacunisphaera sp.]|jgi:excisionase family DNA binding protein
MKTKNLKQLELNGVEAAEGTPKVIDFNEGKMVNFEATASKVHETKPKAVADAEQTVPAAKPKISRPANRLNVFPIMPDGERLLRIHEVAILLRVSDKTVRRMIIDGQLTSRKIRGLRLIRWSDLSNLLNQTA